MQIQIKPLLNSKFGKKQNDSFRDRKKLPLQP